MWPLLQSVVTDSIVVTLDEVRAAIRLLATRHRVIAEGAGAAALAAALSGRAGNGEVACIISGGHIDPKVRAGILSPPAA
jgi:threonine dehydratase